MEQAKGEKVPSWLKEESRLGDESDLRTDEVLLELEVAIEGHDFDSFFQKLDLLLHKPPAKINETLAILVETLVSYAASCLSLNQKTKLFDCQGANARAVLGSVYLRLSA